MQTLPALHADNTHLYPGARLSGQCAARPVGQPTEVVVVFTDHSHAEAMLTPSGDAHTLQVEAYSTAAGTTIETKNWRLATADGQTFIVKSRADSPK